MLNLYFVVVYNEWLNDRFLNSFRGVDAKLPIFAIDALRLAPSIIEFCRTFLEIS